MIRSQVISFTTVCIILVIVTLIMHVPPKETSAIDREVLNIVSVHRGSKEAWEKLAALAPRWLDAYPTDAASFRTNDGSKFLTRDEIIDHILRVTPEGYSVVRIMVDRATYLS